MPRTKGKRKSRDDEDQDDEVEKVDKEEDDEEERLILQGGTGIPIGPVSHNPASVPFNFVPLTQIWE